MVSSAAKRTRRKKLAHERQERELMRPTRQMDPADLSDPEIDQAEHDEIRFAPRGQSVEQMPVTPTTAQAATSCREEDIVSMIKTLNGAIAAISRDTACIQRAYEQLRTENVARDKALADLAETVKEYGLTSTNRRPQPVLREDVVDRDGNLRGADIGITWDDNETFLHGVRVVRPDSSLQPRMRPAASTPHQQIDRRDRDDFPSTVHQQTRPVMSTPYQPTLGQDRDDSPSTVHQQTRPVMSTPYQPTLGQDRDLGSSSVRPVTPEVDYQMRRPPTETRQGYRSAAPIQRFNNKSLNWPAWFRHFRAVADVHGWNKDQRALQPVSYLDETAMNVAQELGDADLYNYDVLVKLLSDRFDPASRVSACRSRFHGRSRRHHEDADTFADALSELCRVGYPQSPAELRQELIAEQFVRGQSDPELKKYLWVVIRTQKDRKLQTLSTSSHLHRPAEQTFAVHQSDETSYMENEHSSEEMFAVGDRPPWTNRRLPETPGVPTLQQMFALAQRMGYEMRPISRQTDAPRQQSGGRPPVGQDRTFRSQPQTGRDYSKFRCFSCGQFGHMQTRCPKPDASLPCKPAGWFLQSEGNGQRDQRNRTENSP